MMENNVNNVQDSAYGSGGGASDGDGPSRSDRVLEVHSDKPNMSCSHHKMGSRNLIVCIDGTSNQFGTKNTNVIEMYKLILKEVDDNQRTWYNSGIGTYAQPSWKSLNFYKKVLYHKIDLAIAWDFERTVLGAYRWLSDNYERGDCIFLFGFSRGAFQVRVLSAMIDKVGLVYKGNELQIPFAYELYADPNSDKPTGNSRMSMADHFKDTFSNKDVKVHFVGAWDTVSSIGIARGKQMLPRTVDGMKHVCYFRHALALDERRVKFLPEYAYGGSTLGNMPTEPQTEYPFSSNERLPESSPSKTTEATRFPQTKEVWFAGTHSDIGGGNAQNIEMDRGRPPLRWMVFEAQAVGLRTAGFERELLSGELIDITESLTGLWRLFEIFPFKRLTFSRREDRLNLTTRKPHLGLGRKIHQGQKIHVSFLRAENESYIPKARPVVNPNYTSFWEMLRKQEDSEMAKEWLELDLDEYIRHLVERLIGGADDTALRSLRHTALSSDTRQNLYDTVIEALSSGTLTPMVAQHLLHSTMDVLKKSGREGPDFELIPSIKIRTFLSDLLEGDNKEYRKIAQEFIAYFTDPCWVLHHSFYRDAWSNGKHIVCEANNTVLQIWDVETGKPVGEPLRGHTGRVLSVVFSSDGKHIVSGSEDGTVRMWDVETGDQLGEPLRGHTRSVRSLAFSSDGKRIVSGSYDGTVRIWDVETGKVVGEPLRGHTDWVKSVAFSSDGKHIASGSDDYTVQIWDVETGKAVGEPLRGHTDSVSSVAFSSDGKHIVSGSYDQTVRIWDVETGKAVGEPLRGHAGWVGSLAFSSDGKRIVSGSNDGTVWIWDVETGKVVGEPLRGHTVWVRSVAFSTDGKHIASGSDDYTVQIWDVETGKAVGEPLRGHTGWVMSVVFSTDGKHIVSGSGDWTVRTWDLEHPKYAIQGR